LELEHIFMTHMQSCRLMTLLCLSIYKGQTAGILVA